MKNSDLNIFSTRLKNARKMAGFSLQDLSDKLENKVSKQALNKYEMGQMRPGTEVLFAIAKALSVKPEYFLRKGVLEFGEISFRKKVKLAKKDEDAIVEKTRDYVERYLELEDILGIQNSFINELKNYRIKSYNDVKEAAMRLREKWELGASPIPNIIEMLELKGIKVLLIDDSEDFDGLAAFSSNGIPLVVINIKDKPLERLRFTIIHELAHILLNFENEVQKDKDLLEKFCHYFASNFILPHKMLAKMIGGEHRSYIAIKELIAIKEYFGISIRATVHRLNQENIINPTYYKKWMVYLNKTYGPKNEPGEYKGNEQIVIFDQLVNRALSEGLISVSKAASLMNCSINDIRKSFISVQ